MVSDVNLHPYNMGLTELRHEPGSRHALLPSNWYGSSGQLELGIAEVAVRAVRRCRLTSG